MIFSGTLRRVRQSAFRSRALSPRRRAGDCRGELQNPAAPPAERPVAAFTFCNGRKKARRFLPACRGDIDESCLLIFVQAVPSDTIYAQEEDIKGVLDVPLPIPH